MTEPLPRELNVIQFTDGWPVGICRELQNADIAITPDGRVIKDRYGMANRDATLEELAAARKVAS